MEIFVEWGFHVVQHVTPVKRAKVLSQFACCQGKRKFNPTKKQLTAKSQRLLLQLATWSHSLVQSFKRKLVLRTINVDFPEIFNFYVLDYSFSTFHLCIMFVLLLFTLLDLHSFLFDYWFGRLYGFEFNWFGFHGKCL